MDDSGNRWRITRSKTTASPDGTSRYFGKAVIDGAVRTSEMGPLSIASTEDAPVYEVDEEVTVEGLPGVVLARFGPGLEESPIDPAEITYVVRILRSPSPFGSVEDDMRQLGAFAIDP